MRMRKRGGALLVFVIVIAVIAIVVFLTVWSGYNKAIRYDEAVASQWAQIENQLTRRFDLIPSLMETVKGYQKHEKELFENIAAAKTKYFQAKGVASKARAASVLESLIPKIIVLQERFPELKANQGFLKFQDQLEGTENRIAVERKRYNDAVRQLNTYQRAFLGRHFCSMAGVVEAGEYFKAPEEKKAVPKVSF